MKFEPIDAFKFIYQKAPLRRGLNLLTHLAHPLLVHDKSRPVIRHCELGDPKFLMQLDLRDRIQYYMFIRNAYTMYAEKVFTRFLGSEFFLIDAGANNGYYSLQAAKINPQASIIAFEPARKNVEAIQTNIQLNDFKNIIVEQKALSNNQGQAKLAHFDQVKESGWGTLTEMQNTSNKEFELVDMIVLDEYLETKKALGKVSFLKVNCQGHDLNVLKGAEQTLASPQLQNMLIFAEETNLQAQQTSSAELNDYLKSKGFQPYEILHGGRVNKIDAPTTRSRESNYLYRR